MPATISLPARDVPVLADVEVLVCGGGTAGIAAACCAARHGREVLLLERWPSVGGMLTNCLVNIWHLSDREKQVIFGFPQEVVDRGGEWVHRFADFPGRHETHWWDSEGARIVLHRMLDECGVRVICNLQAVESLAADGRLRGVLVDTKHGRQAVLAKIVVDATGDGDVAANAGVPFDYGRTSDGLVQGMTMMFGLRGLDEAAQKTLTPEQCSAFVADMARRRDAGEFPPFNEGALRHMLRWGGNFTYWNMLPATADATAETALTAATALTRERLVSYLEYWRAHVPGFARAEINQTGFGVGVRESRRIRGLKTLDRAMVLGAVKHTDAIGHGFWMIDVHDPAGTGHTTYMDNDPAEWLAAGTSYHIPLGMCLNDRIPNLAVVGRCASSTHEGHASVRLQSHCMVMGQGVGTAAALALAAGVDLGQVEARTLQAQLRADGVYLEDVP